ncbi:MAG: sulfurtransferase-like selenium metabolism protein YedF [Sporomusaceae bacterium]|nr:sulfurtransferase-like selenium metabolism protein YedF [Sporomusaceae bacterium]
MYTNIDARGLACPQPVIAVKKALESIVSGVVTITVDDRIAKENVLKFAASYGCGVSITEQDGYFSLKITKEEQRSEPSVNLQSMAAGDTVYLMTQDTLGHGNRELGAVLMKGFVYTLLETKPMPKAILFMNSGILLTIEDSPVLPHLRTLADAGVEILSCGTCLDYYEVKDRLAVGGVTNMYTIVETMSAAIKVITL